MERNHRTTNTMNITNELIATLQGIKDGKEAQWQTATGAWLPVETHSGALGLASQGYPIRLKPFVPTPPEGYRLLGEDERIGWLPNGSQYWISGSGRWQSVGIPWCSTAAASIHAPIAVPIAPPESSLAGRFDIETIEQAFFNYDTDGSEMTASSWEKRRSQWKAFKAYISAHPRQEIGDRSAIAPPEQPKPEYVPWTFETRPMECVWVYKKGFITDRLIIGWRDDGVIVAGYDDPFSYSAVFDLFLQRDGTPCGFQATKAPPSPR
jgi:hypothetical protein